MGSGRGIHKETEKREKILRSLLDRFVSTAKLARQRLREQRQGASACPLRPIGKQTTTRETKKDALFCHTSFPHHFNWMLPRFGNCQAHAHTGQEQTDRGRTEQRAKDSVLTCSVKKMNRRQNNVPGNDPNEINTPNNPARREEGRQMGRKKTHRCRAPRSSRS